MGPLKSSAKVDVFFKSAKYFFRLFGFDGKQGFVPLYFGEYFRNDRFHVCLLVEKVGENRIPHIEKLWKT